MERRTVKCEKDWIVPDSGFPTSRCMGKAELGLYSSKRQRWQEEEEARKQEPKMQHVNAQLRHDKMHNYATNQCEEAPLHQ